MKSVVSFKVDRKIKEKMESLKNEINWPEELRKFVEIKLKEFETKKGKEKIIKKLESAEWSVAGGFSAETVREMRDSN